METALTEGPAFGLGILLPVTLLLLVPLAVAARRAGSLAGGFVIVALWLRYVAGAWHLYMFKPVAAGLSGNALLSIAVVLFGLAFVVRPANLAIRWLPPIYLLMVLALFSAALNGDLAGGINAAVKYAYLLVIALAAFQALRADPEGRFPAWALVAFLPLLAFQALSVALGLPKDAESGDGLVWIGGYNHEAAFSISLVTGFAVACFARSAPPGIRIAFLLAALIGIQLAGYRTAILALAPLALATFYAGLTGGVRRDQRALMGAAAIVAGCLVVAVFGAYYSDRFADLGTLLSRPGDLIQPPRQFDYAERQLMSARPLIWSTYLYAWADGTAAQHLFGFGPESWVGQFRAYPHNTLVATLYELGLFGVAAMLLLWATMLAAAAAAKGERLKLIAAHLSFFILNMATMPFWQVEGLALYGFLCGYSIYRARTAAPSSRPYGAPVPRHASTM